MTDVLHFTTTAGCSVEKHAVLAVFECDSSVLCPQKNQRGVLFSAAILIAWG